MINEIKNCIKNKLMYQKKREVKNNVLVTGSQWAQGVHYFGFHHNKLLFYGLEFPEISPYY